MGKLLKSILIGTAIGAMVPFFFAFLDLFSHVIAYGPFHEETLRALRFTVGIVALIFIIVTLSSLFIGLPATWMLQRLGAESMMAYSIIGGAAGFLVAFLAFQAEWVIVGIVSSVFGLLSGIATAGAWWRWNRARANRNAVDESSA